MFPYDSTLRATVQTPPGSIADVLRILEAIEGICVDGDGLKWFNWLYLQVTQAVENRVNSGGFNDPRWLTELDVQFAGLYFDALSANLTGAPCPGCWSALFAVRDQTKIARIQFALAGMNAHIDHDLPMALITTCKVTQTIPQHGSAQYNDYTALDTTLDSLIDEAKQTLNVRLLGSQLPAVSHLQDTIAAWDLAAARESAWNTAQNFWNESPKIAAAHMDIIDGLTTVISKALLVPVP
jgi:hypothetical protein